MNIRLFLAIMLVSIALFSSTHPIYNRMLKLNPDLDKDYALSVSNAIYKCHKDTGIDKYLLVAIYNLESNLDYKQKNCKKSILDDSVIDRIVSFTKGKPSESKKLRKHLKNMVVKACLDLGLGQINVGTAEKYEECSDFNKLKNDWRYNLACSCSILSKLKDDFGELEPYTFWSRYNTYNPVKRLAYEELVLVYYPSYKKKIKSFNMGTI